MFSRNKTGWRIGQALLFWLLIGWCGSNLRADTFGDFTYTTNSTSATITGYTGVGGDIVIPDVLGGKPVTQIGGKVFYYRSDLTSVVIPASIQTIGNFNFASCFGMTSINVDSNNLSFSSDGGLLFNKPKTELIQCPAELAGTYSVPAGVTNLGYSAFHGCCVTGVTLSASVSSFESYTFGADNLIAINVDENNPNYSSDGGVLFNKVKTSIVRYPSGRTGTYAIPSGVTSIGAYAFEDCSKLTEVAIPAGVTSIGTGAFDLCSGLAKVSLPSSVTNIGMFAFRNCYEITSITIPASVRVVANRLFYGCRNLVRADFLGNAPSGTDSTIFGSCAAGFAVYYLEGASGFTSPTWNGYPSSVLGGTTILPTGISGEADYEAWVLANAANWNTADFTAMNAQDFEKSWLVNTMPETDLAANASLRVENFTVGLNQIQVTLKLGIATQPKDGAVNGWLAIDGRETMTNEWQTIAGQAVGQNRLSFSNGCATVLFDKPADMHFFRPKLQKIVPNGGTILPIEQRN